MVTNRAPGDDIEGSRSGDDRFSTEPVAAGAPMSPWSPLRYRVFRALFIAQLASNLGSLMQAVAAAWLMGDLGASPTLVAAVQTAIFLPVFIVGIPAGALADVVDRRKLLITPTVDDGERSAPRGPRLH